MPLINKIDRTLNTTILEPRLSQCEPARLCHRTGLLLVLVALSSVSLFTVDAILDVLISMSTFVFKVNGPFNPKYSFQSQHPEINDQFETRRNERDVTAKPVEDTKVNTTVHETNYQPIIHIIINIYKIIRIQLKRILFAPKIRSVLRNVGTCVVNGAMEIISYYFPAPIIPLITTAAGMVIPFEPVVMLKQRLPIASYRRAITTAVNTFLNTFNSYKLDYDDDPYMTRRFNRKFKDFDEKPIL